MALTAFYWQGLMALDWLVFNGTFFSLVAGFRGPRQFTLNEVNMHSILMRK